MRVNPASSKSTSRGGGSSNPVSKHPRTKSIYIKKEITKLDRILTTIPGCQRCNRDSFETRISKCVTNIVRHHDQDERETDGAMHWNVILPVLKGRFRNQMDKEVTGEDWFRCFYLGNIKTRFEICNDENGELRYIRAIQGHSGEMIISPRLMNYPMILLETIHQPRGSSTRPTLYCRSWIGGRRKRTLRRKANNFLLSS